MNNAQALAHIFNLDDQLNRAIDQRNELVAALRTVQAQIQPGAHPADITGALITIRAALAKVSS
jgi:hypothetical protein